MSDILSSVLKSITLDGYGASDGFVGFSEEAAKYKPGSAETATDFFLAYHKGSLNEIVVVSSLHINSDEFCTSENIAENEYHISIMQSLISNKNVPVLSYDLEFGKDYDSPLYGASREKICNNFALFPENTYTEADFRNLIISKMIVHGLRGHCFLVFEKLGLAFYSHDYRGFGIVALREDADFSSARDFLKKAGALDGYFSVIER